jgi:hypothetical protein
MRPTVPQRAVRNTPRAKSREMVNQAIREAIKAIKIVHILTLARREIDNFENSILFVAKRCPGGAHRPYRRY